MGSIIISSFSRHFLICTLVTLKHLSYYFGDSIHSPLPPPHTFKGNFTLLSFYLLISPSTRVSLAPGVVNVLFEIFRSCFFNYANSHLTRGYFWVERVRLSPHLPHCTSHPFPHCFPGGAKCVSIVCLLLPFPPSQLMT